jgi:C4-dicarboxylate-specific signal transduction histidine kinase
LRDLEMAFLGKIAASMTHEIKNTFAIILESSGLLSDIITLSKEGAFPHKERFQRALGNIDQQVKRGVDITSRLNQFAHSMDEPWALVNVPGLLEQVTLLMHRLAKRRGIELRAETSDQDLSLMSDPFRLLLVLGSVIDQLADSLESGGKIVLQSHGVSQGATIRLNIQGPKKPGWEGALEIQFSSLKEVLEALKAKLTISSPPDREGVILTIAAT